VLQFPPSSTSSPRPADSQHPQYLPVVAVAPRSKRLNLPPVPLFSVQRRASRLAPSASPSRLAARAFLAAIDQPPARPVVTPPPPVAAPSPPPSPSPSVSSPRPLPMPPPTRMPGFLKDSPLLSASSPIPSVPLHSLCSHRPPPPSSGQLLPSQSTPLTLRWLLTSRPSKFCSLRQR
jgi:hypothetical protein